MSRFPAFFVLLLAADLVVSSDLAAAESDLAGSSWTMVVAQQCQLGQIGKILLQPDGTAQATAQVENSTGSMTVPGDSQSTDLQGSWSYADNVLHLSFNEGSLTLDGPVAPSIDLCVNLLVQLADCARADPRAPQGVSGRFKTGH